MAYFDKYGVEFSDDHKTLVRCPEDFKGEYVIPETVETINEAAFFNCIGLDSVIISENISSISRSSFAYCVNLRSITIPDSIKRIGEFAFGGCKGLTSISIPKSVTSIESEAFCDCVFLDKVYLPKTISYIGKNAFANCGNLIVYIPTGQKERFAQMEGLKYIVNLLVEYKTDIQQTRPKKIASSPAQSDKVKEEEQRKLIEKRKQEQEQTAKENRRIIIFIIIAIIGAIMLFNAKCSKTRTNHHDSVDPAMEYRHS